MKREMYRRRLIKAGNTIDVEETYPTQFGDCLTRERYKSDINNTPVAMQMYNEEIAIRRLTRTINENFVPNDFWVTLHYEKDNRPDTLDEAKAQLSSFITKLRAEYSKVGQELKYVKCTAFGSRGGIHHHLIINRALDTRIITELWKAHIKASIKARPPHYIEMYANGEYSSLAAYIFGQARKTDTEFKNARHWVCSRNLRKPQIIKQEDIEEIKWKERPTAIKGYYIEPDSIKAGCNPNTGRPYLFYRMVKIHSGFTCYDEKGRKLVGKAAMIYYRKITNQFIKDNWDKLNPDVNIIFKGEYKSEVRRN